MPLRQYAAQSCRTDGFPPHFLRTRTRSNRLIKLSLQIITLLPVALLAFASYLGAQTQSEKVAAPPQLKNIAIPRVASRPKIEEFLDHNSRSDMFRVDDFRQRSPGDGAPVSQPTSAWVGYDDANLYIVFVCQSPASQTRARLGKRDDIFSDDIVGVFLDTYHDRQRSYEFFVNPLGVQAEGIVNEGQNDDMSFDTLWYSDGRITAEGFVTLMAIPFRSLRFASADVQTWGFGLGRFLPTNNESSFWPFITNKVNGFSPQLGNAAGLEKITPGRNLQFIPFLTLGHEHYLDNPGSLADGPVYRSNTELNGGLDAKMTFHGSLTVDIALRPDFSQVESDDPQVTVNQRYAVYFSEKRPFFIENNGFFVTPENLFFSRTIIDPEYGGRLTGKLGRWNLGFLTIDDRAAGLSLDPSDPNYGKRAIIGVGRIQREFAKESNIGLLYTDREFAGRINRVAAVDTKIRLNTNWNITAQLMASRTLDPLAGKTIGNAANVHIQASHRNYYYTLGYIDRGAGFNTDLGFVTRVDIRQVEQFANYRWHPKHKALVSWGPRLYANGDVDHRGVQQDWTFNPGMNFEFARSSYLGFGRSETFERFDFLNFRRNSTSVGFHTEYFKKATFDGGYSFGTRINYNPATGVDPFLGHGNEAQMSITVRPFPKVKLDEIYNLTRLNTERGPSVFVNHLWRSRIVYQYNRSLSLRVIVDYNGVLQNPALIDLTRQKSVTGNVLLTWLLHPGTAFYLGYTDTVQNQALVPGEPNSVIQTGYPSATTDRQVFAKISYLFRF